MTYDLVIRGGTVVTPTQIATGDVGIDGGVIREIADELPGGHDEIDARGLLVLPGAVDAHVHLNDPGRSDWEGIATGTAALAVGGSTTAIDMPLNAHPPTVDGAAFDLKAARIAESAHVDIALWGGLVPGNVGQTGGARRARRRGLQGVHVRERDRRLRGRRRRHAARTACARRPASGLPVAVHAESDALTAALAAQAVAEGRTTMRDFLESRPVEAELEAIGRALELAREAGCSLHIVHVSSGSGVALVVRGPRAEAST